jgi:dTDP-4-dehydrorhamnose 3,5-epimerase
MIKGVKVTKLNVFSNDKGSVKHMIKSTDDVFTKFGEIYFSEILPGKVKAWNRRNEATRNYVVVEGKIKLVLYDGHETQDVIMGEGNYCLVTIPPKVWSGFKSLSGKKAIIADFTDLPYDSKDAEIATFDELKNCWND